jgi:hypothetical protein
MTHWRSNRPADCCRSHTAALRLEVDRLHETNRQLRRALIDILKDPHAQLLDSDRDEGWIALGGKYPLST